MKSSMFERLVRDPLHHSMPELAGQRARVAEIIVELRDRVPVQVVRRVYFVLPFDDQGRVDIERIRKQQYALAASVIDPVLAPRKDPADLHDIAVAPQTGGRPKGCLKCANALQYACVCTDSGD